MRCLMLALLLVGLGPARATHAADQDTFDKLVAKVAPDVNGFFTTFKPKLACICSDKSTPGVVAQNATLGGTVSCWTPSFDAQGKLASMEACGVGATFEVLH